MTEGHTRYISHLLRVLPNQLDGLKVVIDAAHGAASMVSPEVFRLAGAEVVEIGTAPDGLNINDGFGSTHLDPLKAAVVAHGAHLGIAHDGDADRCLAVDATGTEVDGDQIMGVLAVAIKERGVLAHDTLVATVMSNLGLLQAMEREGIHVRQTGGRRPLRARGDARRGVHARRGAVRPRHHARPRHHRRRRAHRPDARCPDGGHRPQHRRPRGGHDPPAAGARQRARGRQGPGRERRGPPVGGAPGGGRARRRAVGCCCASRAPSRSCGSWSRRRPRSRRMPSATRLAGVVRERLTP